MVVSNFKPGVKKIVKSDQILHPQEGKGLGTRISRDSLNTVAAYSLTYLKSKRVRLHGGACE